MYVGFSLVYFIHLAHSPNAWPKVKIEARHLVRVSPVGVGDPAIWSISHCLWDVHLLMQTGIRKRSQDLSLHTFTWIMGVPNSTLTVFMSFSFLHIPPITKKICVFSFLFIIWNLIVFKVSAQIHEKWKFLNFSLKTLLSTAVNGQH